MTFNPHAVHTTAPSTVASPAARLHQSQAPRPAPIETRLFEIAALRRDGTQYIDQVKVPALPLFENAFSAFGHGTRMQTPNGEVNIEDLMPGDILCTASGTPAKVLWIGTGRSAPRGAGCQTSFVRIMSDTFGGGRPDSFMTLGRSARILQTPPRLRGQANGQSLLTPVSEFVDGVNVIQITPPTPVQLFHIVLERHAAVRVSGLECETYHPGNQAVRNVSHALRDLFLSMFPHISHVSDFGPLAHPRATDLESDLFENAS